MSFDDIKTRAGEWVGGPVHGMGDITGGNLGSGSAKSGGNGGKKPTRSKGKDSGSGTGKGGSTAAPTNKNRIKFTSDSDDEDDLKPASLPGFSASDAKSTLDYSGLEGGEVESGMFKGSAKEMYAGELKSPSPVAKRSKTPKGGKGGAGGKAGGDGGDKDPGKGGSFVEHFKRRTQGNPLLGAGIMLSGDITKDKMDHGIPDTDEGTIFLGMAYSIAISGLAAPKCSVDSFGDITITIKFPKKYNPEVESGNKLVRGEDTSNGYDPLFTIGKSSDDECGTYGLENIELCPDADEKTLFNTIVFGETDFLQFYIDFLNAYQIKGLKPKNVSSYFAWLKSYNISGDYIASSFHKITGGTPQISADDGLRGMLRDGEWTKYRSTFATIVFVGKRFLDDLPPEFSFLVSDDTRNDVKNSCDKPHDEVLFRKINRTFLAYAYMWSVTCDMDIPGLYSGEKAYKELSTVNQVSMTNILVVVRSRIKSWESSLMTNFTNGVSSIPGSLKNV